MSRGFLQADISDRGIVLDPRTKMLMLFNMALFVLGSAGGERVQALTPFFCTVPAILMISAKNGGPQSYTPWYTWCPIWHLRFSDR